MLDHVTTYGNQLESVTTLDLLTAKNNLEGQLNAFLICCKVDGLSPATLRYYRQKIAAFVKFSYEHQVKELDQVNATHIRLFILKLQKTNCPVSIHDFYRALKRFFNWMVEEGLLEKNPMSPIRPPRIPRKIVKPFTASQINTLLELCDDRKFLGARNKSIVLMFLDTGLRLSELAGIQLGDIDIDRGVIKVMGKGARERVVRIGKTTQKALLRYLLMRHDDHPCLWVTEERKPLAQVGIVEMIKKLGKRAELKGVRCSCHTFRHTFATSCLSNGANLFYVQSLLGHSTLDMVRRYAATIDSEKAVEAHHLFSPADKLRILK